MNLAVDIGNTRTKMGVFDQSALSTVFTFDTSESAVLKDMMDGFDIQGVIISSTIDLPDYLSGITLKAEKNIILSETTPLPFLNQYASKNSLGKDRLALVAAAHARFPHQNNLVIGCGTCITFNFINNRDEFLGGSIHPGLKMRLLAMHTFTGKLPLIELENKAELIGNDTKTNLLSGVLLAASKEIDGMIDEYLVKFPQMNIIITGGDADLLVSRLKKEIFAIPNLTLMGLNHILEYNA
jgi:type III pantothenate kinase